MTKKLGKAKNVKRSFNPTVYSIGISDALKRDMDTAKTSVAESPASSLYRSTQTGKLLSKFTSPDDDSETLEKESFAKFLRMNDHMRTVNEHFAREPDSPVAINDGSKYDLELVLRRAKALVKFTLRTMCEEEYFLGCKSSGGSSIGVPYSNTAPERKYTYPISRSSDRLDPLWRRYKQFNPEFAHALVQLNSATLTGEEFHDVESSRATTVEKTANSRRMIAVEPVVNMFFQQGLMDALVSRLKGVGLDITNVPELHRQLAMENSITASNDTVDFSSASDCVSLEFLRWLLPASWFNKIELVRCPSMLLGGDTVKLEMISTMGNATTFPLETLVFWSIAVSSVMTIAEPNSTCLLPNSKYFRRVSVFGDDCITPRDATAIFMAATEAVGFIVNHDKSFFDGGYFRESCGGDFYRGCNVRPVFLQAPTSTKISALEPWLYAFTNGIIKKYISYFGSLGYVYDKDLFRFIFSIFKKERLLVKVIPDWFPDDAGLKIGDEIHRFQRAYDIPLSRVGISDQGVTHFLYCRFNYRFKETYDDHLRYSLFLKQRAEFAPDWLEGFDILRQNVENKVSRRTTPQGSGRKVKHFYKIRKHGGYVVATGYTPSWTPNFRV